MKGEWSIFLLVVQLCNDQCGFLFMVVIIGGVVFWFLIVGKIDCVVYQGIDKVGWVDFGYVCFGIILFGYYVMEQDVMVVGMKVGCVYDFNYGVEFGCS